MDVWYPNCRGIWGFVCLNGGSMEYIAHINDETKKKQTVKEHSENTAKLCREYAVPALKDVAYAAGLLHDLGKFQDSFQKRICG